MSRSGLVFRKELIHAGLHVKEDQEIDVEEETIDHWIATFHEMRGLGFEVPVPVEHTTDPEANRGHVIEMERGVNSQGIEALFGYIEFVDEQAARLAKSAKVSIYVPPEFSVQGKKFSKPITHVALTDYPVVVPMDEWEPIAASFSRETSGMKLTQAVKAALGKLKFEYDEDKDDEESLAKALASAVAKLAEDKEDKDEEKEASKPAKASSDEDDDKKAAKDDEKEMAVSLSHVEMLRENRETKLQRLVDRGAITPAVKKKLLAKYGSDGTLRLSLSRSDYDDGFTEVVKALEDNEPVSLGHQTGGQSGRTAVALSREHMDPSKNPLLADANRRAGK
jgi:hypothetical protein